MSVRTFNRLPVAVAALCGVAVAVVHHPGALDAALLPRTLLLALGCVLGIALLRKHSVVLREPLTLVFAGFVLLQWLSVLQARVVADALMHCLEWSLLWVAFVLLRVWKGQCGYWPRSLAAGGLGFVATALLLGPLLGTRGENGLWVASFGGSNQYAAVLALCAGMLLVLAAGTQRTWRWLLLGLLACLLLMLWWLGSLAAWLVVLVQVLLLVVHWRKPAMWRPVPLWLLPVALVVLLLGAGSAMWPDASTKVAKQPALVQQAAVLHELGYAGPNSSEIRWLLYGKTYRRIADNPLLGVELGNGGITFQPMVCRNFGLRPSALPFSTNALIATTWSCGPNRVCWACSALWPCCCWRFALAGESSTQAQADGQPLAPWGRLRAYSATLC